ncbi:MAG: hypothetical protein K8H87_14875, partial [Pseudorhodoplanes sp.]|nr:hypothetical protein [Pseudorhodoplanes sp.]
GLTRQSIILRRLFFFATDARVRLARDRSEIGAGGISPLSALDLLRKPLRTFRDHAFERDPPKWVPVRRRSREKPKKPDRDPIQSERITV